VWLHATLENEFRGVHCTHWQSSELQATGRPDLVPPGGQTLFVPCLIFLMHLPVTHTLLRYTLLRAEQHGTAATQPLKEIRDSRNDSVATADASTTNREFIIKDIQESSVGSR
jgi:hypothetical protein